MTVRILTVCTGNICRSPLATQLLRMRLDPHEFVLDSAGTGALVDAPMDALTSEIADDLGVPDARAHRARQVTSSMVAQANLVLALTLEHRRQIVELKPAATKYTYTLREFARIVDEVPHSAFADATDGARDPIRSALAALAAVAAYRGTLEPIDPAMLEVVDPYRRPRRVHEQAAAEIVPAVVSIAKFLRRSQTGFIPAS